MLVDIFEHYQVPGNLQRISKKTRSSYSFEVDSGRYRKFNREVTERDIIGTDGPDLWGRERELFRSIIGPSRDPFNRITLSLCRVPNWKLFTF